MAKLKGKAKAAFLRRMNGAKRKKHGTHSKRRKRGRSTTVAKKRRKRSTRRHTTRRTRRRHHTGGALGRFVPPRDDLISAAAAFGYGKLEVAAGKDQQHVLRKVPALVPQLGRAGNLAALTWVAGVYTRHPIVKAIAKGLIDVAAYQHGRGPAGGFTKDAQDFKLGARMAGSDEARIENYLRNRR